MSEKYTVKLSNGKLLELDPDNQDKVYDEFINLFFKPYFLESNDLNKTISASIKEVERISSIFHLSKGQAIENLLKTIDNRLPKDIAELTGEVDKIEILFENVEDYAENIIKFVNSGDSPESIRLRISQLVENLNLFEISELLIYLTKPD